MILYHAISTYQILEVAMHRMKFHKEEKTILILPDFIINKHEDYDNLVKYGVFDEVYLFPYLQIPHNISFIRKNLHRMYEKHIPYPVERFRKIYVAGVHFFFSLYLIKNRVTFTAFEDAAGMVEKGRKIYDELRVQFPAHAHIADKYHLFDFRNKFISDIIVQKKSLKVRKVQEIFDIESELPKMEKSDFEKILKFFRLEQNMFSVTEKDLLLTERLYLIGKMSEEDQQDLYLYLVKHYLDEEKLIIKPHPDEKIKYFNIFPKAVVLPAKFPSELLPSVLGKNIRCVYTFNSTAIESLSKNYNIKKLNFNEILEEKNESNRCNSSKI